MESALFRVKFLIFTLFSSLTLSGIATLEAQPINYTTPYLVTTLAGQFANGNGYVDGSPSQATFNNPMGAVIDGSGNLYIADTNNFIIRKITANGTTSTVAGQPGISGSTDGIGSAAQFGKVVGIALDKAGNLYITDSTYNTVRKITVSNSTYTVSTVVTSSQGLSKPLGITVDSNGIIYVADSNNLVVRKITPAGVMTILAGTIGNVGGTDGTGANASFASPTGLAVDSYGNLYLTDSFASTLRQITPSGLVTTIGGYYGSPGIQDGPLSNNASQFSHPYAITIDPSNNLYVTDGSSGTYIRKITGVVVANGVISGTVSTLAGNAYPGSADGTGSSATFSNAQGIAVDSSGSIYVSNTGSSTIRKGTPAPLNAPPTITSQPSSTNGNTGFSVSLSVSVSGTSPFTYQWYFNNTALSNNSTVSGATTNTLTISNLSTNATGQYYVVVTNAYGSIKSASATVSLLTPVITNQPQSQNIALNGNVTLSVSNTGAASTYQWYFNGTAISGATSASYTISNAQSSNQGNYTVTITNVYGTVTSNPATITVGTVSNPGRLINLSVLTTEGINNQLLTVGFTTGGANTTGSQSLLIRASGPALTQYGVNNILNDPALTVFNGSTAVTSNDNWGSSASNITAVTAADSATGAFPLTNTTSLDAALVVSLPTNPGYTVQITGKPNTSGNVLAEIYDNTPSGSYTTTTPRLINLSCLQQVAANGILTAGFTINGTTPEKVLIRASGPAIALFGVPATMPDPTLSVFSGTSVIASNSSWGTPLSNQNAVAAAEASTGAFAYTNTSSHDSALVLTLQPGSYTVQATSSSGISGTTLIEVYEVP